MAEFVADAQSMSSFFSAGVDYVQGDFVASTSPTMQFEFG